MCRVGFWFEKNEMMGLGKFYEILSVYKDRDFATREIARFTLFTTLGYTVILTILSIYTCVLFFVVPEKEQYSHTTLYLLLSSSLFVGFSVYLIYKGFYQLATHIVFSSSFVLIWLIMWTDNGDQLTTFDTVVFVFALFALLPLLIRRIWLIVFYLFANGLIASVFVLSFATKFDLSTTAVRDFITDTGFSMLIFAFGSYSVFVINERILKHSLNDINERTKAELALLQSERKYTELTDMLPQPVFEADAKGVITYVNRSGYKTFLYDETDLERCFTMFDMIIPSDRLAAMKHIGDLSDTTQVKGNFYTGLRKDGTTFPVQVFSNPVFEKGVYKGFRGVIIDISERRLAEQKIEESRDQFSSLVSNIPGTTYRCLLDEKWTMLYLSDDIKRITGYPASDFINNAVRTFGSIIHPNDNSVNDNVILEAVKENLPWELEYRIFHKSGEIKWVYEKGRAVKDKESGEVKYFDGFLLDITERKQKDELLKLSEERNRTILEALPDLIVVSDFDGRILYANSLFIEQTGLNAGDSFYDPLKPCIHPEDMILLEQAAIALEEGSHKFSGSFEFRYYRKDGHLCWVSAIVSKLIFNDRSVLQTIARDITYKKEIEDELLRYRSHLETLVKERTLSLEMANNELLKINSELDLERKNMEATLQELKDAQERLIQSEKMASLGILTAGIAHEINNPLNFINAGAIGVEAYIQDNLTEHYQELKPMLDGIQIGVKRSADIVTGLSHYSYKSDNVFDYVDLHEIIDNCLVMLLNQTKGRIEILKEYSISPLMVHCNEGRIHQVFLNILVNSVQAIENEGYIKIKTSLTSSDAIIDICDNGSGIEPQILNRITDPFFTTKPPGKGTGLGLAISMNIIKEHHGTLRFTSNPGENTTATIVFPRNI